MRQSFTLQNLDEVDSSLEMKMTATVLNDFKTKHNCAFTSEYLYTMKFNVTHI